MGVKLRSGFVVLISILLAGCVPSHTVLVDRGYSPDAGAKLKLLYLSPVVRSVETYQVSEKTAFGAAYKSDSVKADHFRPEEIDAVFRREMKIRLGERGLDWTAASPEIQEQIGALVAQDTAVVDSLPTALCGELRGSGIGLLLAPYSFEYKGTHTTSMQTVGLQSNSNRYQSPYSGQSTAAVSVRCVLIDTEKNRVVYAFDLPDRPSVADCVAGILQVLGL